MLYIKAPLGIYNPTFELNINLDNWFLIEVNAYRTFSCHRKYFLVGKKKKKKSKLKQSFFAAPYKKRYISFVCSSRKKCEFRIQTMEQGVCRDALMPNRRDR
jgi:hypothetical protein